MSDQVTKITIRKGTLEQKNAITLSEAELGYTTDTKRVVIGDGKTVGGISFSNKYLGSFANTLSVESPIVGDIIYNQSVSEFQILTGTDAAGNVSDKDYVQLSSNDGTVTRLDAGTGIIFNTADATITKTGSINVNISGDKRNLLKNTTAGLIGDYDILYPVHSVIFTDNNINPSDPGGILEGAGQTWVAFGTITTSPIGLTPSGVIYSWLRAG